MENVLRFWAFVAVCLLAPYVPLTNAGTVADISVINGLVSVNVTDAELSEVAKTIGEQAVPPFHVSAFRSRKVTARFKDVPVVEALRLLIQNNFTLILDKKTRQPVKVFLLNEGEGVSVALLDQEATDEFQEVLKNSPEQEVRVRAVLSVPTPLSAVKYVLMGEGAKNITLKSLQHTTGTQTGGYLLEEGESLEDAFASYERDHQLFLSENVTQMQDLASGADEPEIREAAKRGIADLDKVKEDFANRGLRITNLELEGKAQDIAQFQKDVQLAGDIELVKTQTQER
jgi:hypothetical protein